MPQQPAVRCMPLHPRLEASLHSTVMPSRNNSKRATTAAARRPFKRARPAHDVETNLNADNTLFPSIAASTTLVLSSSQSSSVSSSSIASVSASPSLSTLSTSSCTFSSSSHCAAWADLPLELLVLVAECVPSFLVLLPLSSTCRRLYELIHEESVSGVVQAANSLVDQSVRLSCWGSHPLVRVVISRPTLRVDGTDFSLAEYDTSFVSRVLTSLRNVLHLELIYACAGSPHAANLHPFRHFIHLRSLVLLLGREDEKRLDNLAANISTALLSLTSLVSLTVFFPATPFITSQLLELSTLQRLTTERLLHVTLNMSQFEQLSSSLPAVVRRKRDNRPAVSHAAVLSVVLTRTYDYEHGAPTINDVARLFPNVQHVTHGVFVDLDWRAMTPLDDAGTMFRLDSLQCYVERLYNVQHAQLSGYRCQLRCLILHWDDHVRSEYRASISAMLALMPNLTQLAIVGGGLIVQRSNIHLDELPSVFGADDLQLSELTYLQFTGGLLTQDIEYLLPPTPAAAPAFATSLTHLALRVRWADRQLAASRLHLLSAIYPNLQKCHIAFQPASGSDKGQAEWKRVVDAVRSQLGEVWCDSDDEVCMARSDVAWRRSVGLLDELDRVVNEGHCLTTLQECELLNSMRRTDNSDST